jgi:inosine/xanthosine triphosphatase
MRITICGSMKFIDEMEILRASLEELGIDAMRPLSFKELGLGDDLDLEVKYKEESSKIKKEYDLVRMHPRKIDSSDGILVANYEKNGIQGYIGGNTLLEIYHAFSTNKNIYLINEIPKISYKSEIEAMSTIVIGNDLRRIFEDYASLPNVYVTSMNELKINAVSKGLSSLGGKYNVTGMKSSSDVPDQPVGLKEIFDGASNRIENLKFELDKSYEFIVSLENGLIAVDDYDIYLDVGVCIIENSKGEKQYSTSGGTSIPTEVVKDVLNSDSEIGEYVRKNMKISTKDGVSAFTNGHILRENLLAEAVKTCYAKFLI